MRLPLLAVLLATVSPALAADSAQLGPRPFFLVDVMDEGPLKEKLKTCTGPFSKTDWSIGHRGAPMQFPEHTRESYEAAARMGAGIVECDVTFTKDKELVCRHAQNDLHTTTDILATPLAAQCTQPFQAAAGEEDAKVECRASDITLADFRTLVGKMDAGDKKATDVAGYMDATAGWRTDLYSAPRKGQGGTLMTLAESIALNEQLGVKHTPELKAPSVDMPCEGFSQEDYALKMIDAYVEAGVKPENVWAQSFNLNDVLLWIRERPDFGKQAVYLDDSYDIEGWSPMDEGTWPDTMASLKERGVNYIAPPMWVLVTEKDGRIVPSLYAERAKEAGLKIITWTAERSGPLGEGGGWYFQSLPTTIDDDGDIYEVLRVLHEDVGVEGVFSDWPATTTFYANCTGAGD